jgi:hypothetical protein
LRRFRLRIRPPELVDPARPGAAAAAAAAALHLCCNVHATSTRCHAPDTRVMGHSRLWRKTGRSQGFS